MWSSLLYLYDAVFLPSHLKAQGVFPSPSVLLGVNSHFCLHCSSRLVFLSLAPESPGWVCHDFLESDPKQSQWDSDLRGIGTEDFMLTCSWSSPAQNLIPCLMWPGLSQRCLWPLCSQLTGSSALCLDLLSQRQELEMPLWKETVGNFCGIHIMDFSLSSCWA